MTCPFESTCYPAGCDLPYSFKQCNEYWHRVRWIKDEKARMMRVGVQEAPSTAWLERMDDELWLARKRGEWSKNVTQQA